MRPARVVNLARDAGGGASRRAGRGSTGVCAQPPLGRIERAAQGPRRFRLLEAAAPRRKTAEGASDMKKTPSNRTASPLPLRLLLSSAPSAAGFGSLSPYGLGTSATTASCPLLLRRRGIPCIRSRSLRSTRGAGAGRRPSARGETPRPEAWGRGAATPAVPNRGRRRRQRRRRWASWVVFKPRPPPAPRLALMVVPTFLWSSWKRPLRAGVGRRRYGAATRGRRRVSGRTGSAQTVFHSPSASSSRAPTRGSRPSSDQCNLPVDTTLRLRGSSPTLGSRGRPRSRTSRNL